MTPEELDQRYKSREIDKFLEKDKQTFRRQVGVAGWCFQLHNLSFFDQLSINHVFNSQVKLLLLGAGESGKSTFLKQMRIIHDIKFEPDLMREYQHVIYQNIIKGMQVLVDAREKLDIAWEHPTTEHSAEKIREFYSGPELHIEQFHQYAPVIRLVWQDRAIHKTYNRRREFQIVSLLYCFKG